MAVQTPTAFAILLLYVTILELETAEVYDTTCLGRGGLRAEDVGPPIPRSIRPCCSSQEAAHDLMQSMGDRRSLCSTAIRRA
eukprot:14560139-Heterocapsa_arctica.AAC.1